MSFAKLHILEVSRLHEEIERNEFLIKKAKKRIKKQKKKIEKMNLEAIKSFNILAESSSFLKGREWKAYPTRQDALSLFLIVYVDGNDYYIDMSDWAYYEANEYLVNSFDEMLRLRMHDLDQSPPQIIDWDKDEKPPIVE